MVFDMFYDYKHQHRSVILTKVAESGKSGKRIWTKEKGE